MSTVTRLRNRLYQLLCADRDKTAAEESPDGTGYPPLVLPASLAMRTQKLLRSFHTAEHGCEGLVYWAGIAEGRGGTVSTLVVPDAVAGYGRVETTPQENAEVIRLLGEHGLVLLGQAHSHPPGAGNRHSPGDDVMTFSPFEGQVSVVVSDHAAAREGILDSWGVHRFIRGEFRFIDPMRWDDHLRVVPDEVDRRFRTRGNGGRIPHG